MGRITDAKAAVAAKDAAKAHEAGHQVYVHRLKLAMTQANMSGPLSGFAEQIEAIEAVGWHLDRMAFDDGAGVFLFRRA